MEQILELISDRPILSAIVGLLTTYFGAEIATFVSKLKGKTILWSYILKPIIDNASKEYEEYKVAKAKEILEAKEKEEEITKIVENHLKTGE